LCQLRLARRDGGDNSLAITHWSEGLDAQAPLHLKDVVLGRWLPTQPSAEAREAQLITVDPGHGNVTSFPFASKQGDAGPLFRAFA
jgi:hypothetical protein